MSLSHFFKICLAETRKTFGRGSGWFALVIAALVPLLALGAMSLAMKMQDGAQINGASIDQLIKFTAPTVLAWALSARNFYVLPLVILWSAGASVAGEIQDQTIREILVRPVPRIMMLFAKLISLVLLSLTTLIVTFFLASVGGVALYGTEGEWSPVFMGYLVSWLADIGLISMGLLVSTISRSVAGTVIGVTLFLMVDLGTRLLLKLAGVIGFEKADTIIKWFPGEALGVWEGYTETWSGFSFAALGVLVAVCLSLTWVRFRKMDI